MAGGTEATLWLSELIVRCVCIVVWCETCAIFWVWRKLVARLEFELIVFLIETFFVMCRSVNGIASIYVARQS